MLELRNIIKEYEAGSTKVKALNGVSLSFREHEFVAVLGHSGCGKTTLLNIIGGLDHYTSGDLIINGVSTKQYKDRDWDRYRNHSIGFVFQSYNLIPHQNVLSNVELALTISGVSKSERRRRAREALEKVGLGDQLHKKPNQMSGGQMQRVAIARALVNNPDILLADEPTGALDSETSVQVMDILREISRDKLVIMVTHNPELARDYASRIIRIKDGTLVSDSDPFTAEKAPEARPGKEKKVSMSFLTAFGLSLNNLMTKKGRTFMTAFAGSIGIIGIALILSLSNGINLYINKVQEDTLSSYPIVIEKETTDTSSLISSLMDIHPAGKEEEGDREAVYSNTVAYDIFNTVNSSSTTTNNLKDFKVFLEGDEEINTYQSVITYGYDLELPIYTKDAAGAIVTTDFMDTMEEAMGTSSSVTSSKNFAQFSPMANMEIFEELLPGENGEAVSELLTKQYDLLYGSWPENPDEIVLIVNHNNEIADMILYTLGFKDSSALPEILKAAMNGETIDEAGKTVWTYEEICEKEYKLILPCEKWQYSESTGGYTDLSATETGLDYLYNSETIGMKLKIVGIIRPNEEASASMLSGSIGYTSKLTEYAIQKTKESEIVQKQQADEGVDVFTGLPFATDEDTEPSDAEKASAFKAYAAGLSAAEKAEIYRYVLSVPDDAYLDAAAAQAMEGMTREAVEEMVAKEYAGKMGVDAASVAEYISEMDDETLFANVEKAIREQAAAQYAAGVEANLSALSADQLALMLDAAEWTDGQYALAWDEFMPPTVSDATLDDNYETLGLTDMEDPDRISIYASTFSDKDRISDRISAYNDGAAEEDQIAYTDYVALLMSSITDIISGISYVLIAFVAISLVVSSIMIGIITYISVLERTREIGILRAIGASKKDIARVFNAETLLVGLCAGLIGIGVSLLLNIPINFIIVSLTGIASLNAVLPAAGAVILVIISMALTFIAGLIPSRVAARKDPVIALRTE